jgi:hypothetical protein
MEITGEIVLFVVGLVVLSLLLTGPGMWSEKWGWGVFRKRPRKDKKP